MTANTSTENKRMERGEDFRELIDLALASGAGDAVVIAAGDVLLDPRVRLKCLIPPCYMSGKCSHCPPDGYSMDETREIVSRYSHCVFFRVPVNSRFIASPLVPEALLQYRLDDRGDLWILGLAYILVVQIAVLLEKRAGELGFRATGFTAGDCKDILCFFHSHCMALISSRKGCRHPDLARPSMESCGMNVFAMAAGAGWEAYPIGGTCRPGDVPQGALMGLVLLNRADDPVRQIAESRTDRAGGSPPDPPFTGFLHRLQVYREKNVSLVKMLLLAFWSGRRQYLRVLRNFRRIEGSWSGALKQMKNVQYL